MSHHTCFNTSQKIESAATHGHFFQYKYKNNMTRIKMKVNKANLQYHPKTLSIELFKQILWISTPFLVSYCVNNLNLTLTHWGRETHKCVGNLTTIGSDNGLSPGRCQAIIWTNAGILLIGPWGANFSEILIEILILSFKKMWFKVSSAKWRPFCLGLNELTMSWMGMKVQVYMAHMHDTA